MKYPRVSIIIATLNSERTLEYTLNSIDRQNYPSNKIEILITDGGSSDKTVKIARKFSCKIIKNLSVEPVAGKFIAAKKAEGDYWLFLDSDEVIENTNSLRKKVFAFQENKKVRAVIGNGYKNPKNSTFITKYINEFGDPFSFFIYKISKNHKYFLDELKNRFRIIEESNEYIILDFYKQKHLPVVELTTANSMVDSKYVRKQLPNAATADFPHFFSLLIGKKNLVAITKKDPVVHHSLPNFAGYLNKIKSRIKYNIHYSDSIGAAGYIGREKHQQYTKLKKYFFILYAYTIIFPLFDSIRLVYSRRDISYFLHAFLVYYTGVFILYNYILKLLNIQPSLKSYGEGKIIE